MKLKTAFAALVLMFVPGLSIAQGCSDHMGQQEASISCAAGTTYDATTNTCVTDTTS